jgi:hypothetical protein
MSEMRGIADIGLPSIIFHYRDQFSLTAPRESHPKWRAVDHPDFADPRDRGLD